MPTLITPVQYEAALEELNALRPLQLAKTVQRLIDIPLVNKEPAESKKSVTGTLVRGTQDGSLLTNNVHELTHYEKIEYDETIFMGNVDVEFAQLVKHVVFKLFSVALLNELWWCVPDTDIKIQDVLTVGIHQLNFVGTKISFYHNGVPIQNLTFAIYGLY